MTAASSATAEPGGSPRRTRGFVAFVGVLILPGLVALAVVLGAGAVSGEVYAAQEAAASGRAGAAPVAGWKTALVAACPIH